MRFIAAGKYGVASTLVNPQKNRPIVSYLVPFNEFSLMQYQKKFKIETVFYKTKDIGKQKL